MFLLSKLGNLGNISDRFWGAASMAWRGLLCQPGGMCGVPGQLCATSFCVCADKEGSVGLGLYYIFLLLLRQDIFLFKCCFGITWAAHQLSI